MRACVYEISRSTVERKYDLFIYEPYMSIKGREGPKILRVRMNKNNYTIVIYID